MLFVKVFTALTAVLFCHFFEGLIFNLTHLLKTYIGYIAVWVFWLLIRRAWFVFSKLFQLLLYEVGQVTADLLICASLFQDVIFKFLHSQGRLHDDSEPCFEALFLSILIHEGRQSYHDWLLLNFIVDREDSMASCQYFIPIVVLIVSLVLDVIDLFVLSLQRVLTYYLVLVWVIVNYFATGIVAIHDRHTQVQNDEVKLLFFRVLCHLFEGFKTIDRLMDLHVCFLEHHRYL